MGEPIVDDRRCRIGLQGYHYKNMKEFFGISEEEATAEAPAKVISTNAMGVFDEMLSHTKLVVCPEEERWIMLP